MEVNGVNEEMGENWGNWGKWKEIGRFVRH